MMKRIHLFVRIVSFALLFLSAGAIAQDGRPLRVVVPFPPGGAVDTLARA